MCGCSIGQLFELVTCLWSRALIQIGLPRSIVRSGQLKSYRRTAPTRPYKHPNSTTHCPMEKKGRKSPCLYMVESESGHPSPLYLHAPRTVAWERSKIRTARIEYQFATPQRQSISCPRSKFCLLVSTWGSSVCKKGY